jgi:hypothetical protein
MEFILALILAAVAFALAAVAVVQSKGQELLAWAVAALALAFLVRFL